MASIKQKTERKFKIIVSNGYHTDGRKICKAKTVTVPNNVSKRGIHQYVSHAAEEFEREVRYGYSEDADTSFEVYAEKWLARQKHYAPSTMASYRAMLKAVYPHIGGIKLCKLRPIALEELCEKLRQRQHRSKIISETTVQKYLLTVSSVLEDAKRNEIIRYNPTRMVNLPLVAKKEKEIPPLEEMLRLLQILQQEPQVYRVYYFLALYTGCRRGELCALTWYDILGPGIQISKSRSRVQGLGVVEKTPKNYKSRTIFLNDWAFELLKELFKQQMSIFSALSSDDKIFVNKRGCPIAPDTFSKRLRKTFAKHGFSKEYTLHTLRHFFASYLMQNNISKQVTADLLGHGDTSFLERTYCHPQLEYKEQAADCITQFLCMGAHEPDANVTAG